MKIIFNFGMWLSNNSINIHGLDCLLMATIENSIIDPGNSEWDIYLENHNIGNIPESPEYTKIG